MDVLPDAAGVAYAELHCVSNFSFLRGASHPVELVDRAHALGYRALALTDECSVAGVVRAHVRAKALALPLIIGAQFTFTCGLKLVILAATRQGYGQLCELITRGRRAAPKGSYHLSRADLVDCIAPTGDCLLLWRPAPDSQIPNEPGRWLATQFPGHTWLGVSVLREAADASKLRESAELAARLGINCVACGDVHMHVAERRPLQDALTAIRHGVSLRHAGQRLFANGQRHLRERAELARLYPPQWLQESVHIAERCRFSLDQLRYEYPREIVPAGETPASYLRRLAEEGAAQRWPLGVPATVHTQLQRELALIAELGYEPFFLTVYDIAAFARSAGILHQGRGSAANSLVCYCLRITAVGPDQLSMLFERFVSREREEPPDIDIDFEHERREEVIQYIYGKYGRGRAALAATVITYQVRSAVRDLARALDVDETTQRRLVAGLRGWHGHLAEPQKLRAAGVDPESEPVATLLRLAATLVGFPRHLSQHVGGFVVSEGPLSQLVPVENATMPERTVIQWDKDDLEDLRLLKVDVLGLGMLTAIRRCFDLVRGCGGPALRIDTIPMDDMAVYDMICDADTIGVFQIESRAQMSMLPRLRPREYYDLVIEVAIVRPGPIQGDMVHPYLRRRSGAEPVVFPSEAVRTVLSRTCGVPIFQEQVMQLAMVAADFTPGEADQLRRSMAAWKRRGGIGHFEDKLITGMRRNGYAEQFSRQLVNQIRGFSEYGFPEAHAASFAVLAYVSSWLKYHHPAAFTAALLNSQPMGFYAPAQLLRDLRAHGGEVRSVDVGISDVECTLEHVAAGSDVLALRLGLGCARSFPDAAARRVVAARAVAPFSCVTDLGDRAGLSRHELEMLAACGALAGLEGHRHLAYWGVSGYLPPLAAAPDAVAQGAQPLLRTPTEAEDIIADYQSLGFTLGRHPLALLRHRLQAARILTAGQLQETASGDFVRVAGLVITRQRPHTASGVTFVTLEDESGQVNVLVWRALGERQHGVLVGSRLMEVRGELQREAGVTHVIATSLVDRSFLLGALQFSSHEFH
ncbi:MAG: error-prone DNA polymerase [Pseudomonadota bacterium]